MLWAGLVLLITQWSLFLRLTFWELSWDVMEPISYFFTSLWGILAYCYFLVGDTFQRLLRSSSAVATEGSTSLLLWIILFVTFYLFCRSPKRTLLSDTATAK